MSRWASTSSAGVHAAKSLWRSTSWGLKRTRISGRAASGSSGSSASGSSGSSSSSITRVSSCTDFSATGTARPAQ